jgi:hypothetical protein
VVRQAAVGAITPAFFYLYYPSVQHVPCCCTYGMAVSR